MYHEHKNNRQVLTKFLKRGDWQKPKTRRLIRSRRYEDSEGNEDNQRNIWGEENEWDSDGDKILVQSNNRQK